jgi:O-methyltransferase domain
MAQAETEELTRMLMAVALSRALCSVAELGIADHIETGSPQPVSALAAATGTHEPSLYRILRFLASYGVFQETGDGRFDHTRLSAVLRGDAAGSFQAAARMFHRIFPGWDGIHHSLQTGEPGFDKAFGQPIFQYAAVHPDLGPILDAGMSSVHGHETSAMLDAFDFSGIRVLADVGGGNGSLLAATLQRYPAMAGILYDLGHVVGRARANIERAGVADRCTILEGNFFETVPPGADAYLFRHIIHDWTDEQSIGILGRCRDVLPADGRLFIVEAVVPEGNVRSLAKDYDMTMLTFPGGLERTAREYESLLDRAGFRLEGITPTTSLVSVIEGRPGRAGV